MIPEDYSIYPFITWGNQGLQSLSPAQSLVWLLSTYWDLNSRSLTSNLTQFLLDNHPEFKPFEMLIFGVYMTLSKTSLQINIPFISLCGSFSWYFLTICHMIHLASEDPSLQILCINRSLLADFKYAKGKPRIKSMTNCQIHDVWCSSRGFLQRVSINVKGS